MSFASIRRLTIISLILLVATACNLPGISPVKPAQTNQTTEQAPAISGSPTSVPTQTPLRSLVVCMGSEPASLFLYGDQSASARNIRQAIYDGPFDLVNYALSPVILEKMPSLAGGEVTLEPVDVSPGNNIVDINGNLVTLGEGVVYLPIGCSDSTCAQTYTGSDVVQMDQLAVRFNLRSDLRWSDGAPLTADDSLYSFEVAQALYPRAQADLLAHTQSYTALDQTTTEWRALPGYREASYADNFFSPLPRHAWGTLNSEDLLSAEISSRKPLGWGVYQIDEWTSGDHITLSRNSNYFRGSEGLPAFDKLVIRFIPSRSDALAAFEAGECDYLDETLHLEADVTRPLELQQSGRATLRVQAGSAWEQASFGIVPLNSPQNGGPLPIFQVKETRQAFASCIDRQRLVNDALGGKGEVADTYVQPAHPLFNTQARRYSFDPQAASALFDAAGWKDVDNDPATPRVAQGVAGIPDGTPLSLALLTTTEEEKGRAAQVIKESLAQCGVQIEISALPWEQLLASGPEGPVFGRNFTLAQFGWIASNQPACTLFNSNEIPGPYPEHPKGWGGANSSGYSNPEYDRLCRQALFTLADFPEQPAAHLQAQAIFAEELPVIPLYWRQQMILTRPDLCGVPSDPLAESPLWNLEAFNFGGDCPNQ